MYCSLRNTLRSVYQKYYKVVTVKNKIKYGKVYLSYLITCRCLYKTTPRIFSFHPLPDRQQITPPPGISQYCQYSNTALECDQ